MGLRKSNDAEVVRGLASEPESQEAWANVVTIREDLSDEQKKGLAIQGLYPGQRYKLLRDGFRSYTVEVFSKEERTMVRQTFLKILATRVK